MYRSGAYYRNFGINYLTENYEHFLLDGKTVILLYSLGEQLMIFLIN